MFALDCDGGCVVHDLHMTHGNYGAMFCNRDIAVY